MTKGLIVAIFLSQSPIQDVRVFHEQPTIVDYLAYELTLNARRVNLSHVHRVADGAVVVSENRWYTPKAPIPYASFWNCPRRQTAQQCVAIESYLQHELPNWTWQKLHPVFPDGPEK